MNFRFYPYATDSSERDDLVYPFALIGVGIGYLIYLLITRWHLPIPWWIDPPSPIAVYLVLRSFFSKQAWRWPVFHRFGVVRIPDLNGIYSGFIVSDFSPETRHECEFRIVQTWTTISVRGEFTDSNSYNMVTGISVEGTDSPRMTYEYWSEPKATAPDNMQAHRGTIWFDILIDGDRLRLAGDYYTGRGRGTFGHIEAARVSC